MVKSQINSDINYLETTTCNKNDKNVESFAILLTIMGIDVVTLIGNKDEKYTDKGVIFFPIYLMNNEEFVSKIGVFEIPNDFISTVYENDELNVEILNDPLLFSFVDNEYLKKYTYVVEGEDDILEAYQDDEGEDDEEFDLDNIASEYKDLEDEGDIGYLYGDGEDDKRGEVEEEFDLDNISDEYQDEDEDGKRDEVENEFDLDNISDEYQDEDEEEYEDEDDNSEGMVFDDYSDDTTPDTPSNSDEEEDDEPVEDYSVILDDLIEQDTDVYNVKQTKKEYKESIKLYKNKRGNNWLNRYFKDNKYEVIDNEGGGDCFFAVVRDAFKSIGKNVSVGTIRNIIANEATQELFDNYKGIYNTVKSMMNEKKMRMNKIYIENNKIKKGMKGESKKSKSMVSANESGKLVKEYENLKQEYNDDEEMMNEYRFLKGVKNLSDFKKVIRTCSFWAETWAISTVERIFNIKLIIVSTESYRSGQYDRLIMCGQLNDETLKSQGGFTPKYYLMTEWTGNHYKTIAYDGIKMMKFNEIPYIIKEKIVSTCLERGDGPFGIIPKFQTFKKKFLGNEEDEEDKETTVEKSASPKSRKKDKSPTKKKTIKRKRRNLKVVSEL